MDKRVTAGICAAILTGWLFALAFGSANGVGVHAGGTAVQVVRTMTAAEQITQTEPTGRAAAAPQAGQAAPELELPCKAAVLIEEQSGTVLYEKEADTPLPIASITKVMTLLLTFEAIHNGKIDYTDHVPISEHGYSMGGSQIWLEPGEDFTLDELLKAICVSSANDAAVVVAEYVGGSEPAFVSQMNARAAELGMANTTFCNACGLDEAGHLSTARDVATMSRQILRECPEVLNYTGIWMDSLRGGQTQLINTNKLLKHYNGVTGLKTGTTGGAGVCISASATRDGLSLIAVVLGASSSADRFAAATSLLDYGFSNYEAAALPSLTEAPLECTVYGGEQAEVGLDYSQLPTSMLLKKGQGKDLTAKLEIPQKTQAPVAQGDVIGTVAVYGGETLLGEYSVTAAQSVKKLDFGTAVRLLAEKLVCP